MISLRKMIQRMVNSKISEITDLIYPCELEIKDPTESISSVSYLDYYLCVGNGKLVTRLSHKILPYLNFQF